MSQNTPRRPNDENKWVNNNEYKYDKKYPIMKQLSRFMNTTESREKVKKGKGVTLS